MPNNDYVKRENIYPAVVEIAKEIVFGGQDDDKVVDIINSIPAADVEPVRHGKWIPINRINPIWSQFGIAQHKCSECGSEEVIARKRCPECGAKMDGGDGDAEVH